MRYLLIFWLLNAGFAMAQRTEVFVLGGINGSKLNENTSTTNNGRLWSPTFGVMAAIGSPAVLFKTGILYSTRGTRLTLVGSDDRPKIKLNYIDIPAMVTIAPQNFRFFAGPQYSILTDQKYNDSTTTNYKKNGWGFRFGAGYEKRKVMIQLHFTRSFSDLNTNAGVNYRDNSFQLTFGYVLFRNMILDSKKKEDDIVPEHRVID